LIQKYNYIVDFMPEISKIWTILQFKPNAHKIAEHNLNKQNLKTFLPFEEITKYKNKKFVTNQRPLFPGYMFVEIEKNRSLWHKINSTHGVSKLLTFNNQLSVVPDALISSIMERCNKEGALLSPKKFSKGDSVRIVSGPFGNFLATVDNIDENQRIWVLLDIMGQATRALIKEKKLKLDS
jgi:transcriptional antiterminator RfaH